MLEAKDVFSPESQITGQDVFPLLHDFRQKIPRPGRHSTGEYVAVPSEYQKIGLANAVAHVLNALPGLRDDLPRLEAQLEEYALWRSDAIVAAVPYQTTVVISEEEEALIQERNCVSRVIEGVQRSLEGKSTEKQFGKLAHFLEQSRLTQDTGMFPPLSNRTNFKISQHELKLLALYPQVFQHVANKNHEKITPILPPQMISGRSTFRFGAENKQPFGEGATYAAAKEAAAFLEESNDYRLVGATMWAEPGISISPFYQTTFYIVPNNERGFSRALANMSEGGELLEATAGYMNGELASLKERFTQKVPGYTVSKHGTNTWGEIRIKDANPDTSTVSTGSIAFARKMQDGDITYIVRFKLLPDMEFAQSVFAGFEKGNELPPIDPTTDRPLGERITLRQIREFAAESNEVRGE